MALPDEAGMAAEISGLEIADAEPYRDPQGHNSIAVRLDPNSADRFGAFTAAHIGSVAQVIVGENVIAAPRILSAIAGAR